MKVGKELKVNDTLYVLSDSNELRITSIKSIKNNAGLYNNEIELIDLDNVHSVTFPGRPCGSYGLYAAKVYFSKKALLIELEHRKALLEKKIEELENSTAD